MYIGVMDCIGIDLELVGLQNAWEAMSSMRQLRGFCFDFGKYPVSKNTLCFSFEHHDYNSKNITHILYYSNNYLLYIQHYHIFYQK